MWETQVRSLGQEDPLEKGMTMHSSILAWRIPWTEQPGGPQSMDSQRVRHDWETNTSRVGSKLHLFLCVWTKMHEVYLGGTCSQNVELSWSSSRWRSWGSHIHTMQHTQQRLPGHGVKNQTPRLFQCLLQGNIGFSTGSSYPTTLHAFIKTQLRFNIHKPRMSVILLLPWFILRPSAGRISKHNVPWSQIALEVSHSSDI